MTQEREVLKLALEALIKTQNEGFNLPGSAIREAITAIKEALAQPEPCDMKDMCIGCSPRNADGSCPNAQQEPVACQHNRYSIDVHEQVGNCLDCGAEGRMRFIVGTPQRNKGVRHDQT